MLVPIVLNGISVALMGLANGSYSQQDAEVLLETLPSMWTAVVLDSIARTKSDGRHARELAVLKKQVSDKNIILYA